MAHGYVVFSDAEVTCGVEYAREKYNFALNHDLLLILANRTRAHMAKNNIGFSVARFEVLNTARLHAHNKAEEKKRAAYEGALGKMFGARRKFSAKAAPATKVRPKTRSRHATNACGQLEWLF